MVILRQETLEGGVLHNFFNNLDYGFNKKKYGVAASF